MTLASYVGCSWRGFLLEETSMIPKRQPLMLPHPHVLARRLKACEDEAKELRKLLKLSHSLHRAADAKEQRGAEITDAHR
jgi:hypothetical protein